MDHCINSLPLILLLILAGGLYAASASAGQARPIRSIAPLIDPHATPKTIELWNRLHASSTRGMLFGNHHSHLLGLGWTGLTGQCDIVSVSGLEPSLCSFDPNAMLNSDAPKARARLAVLRTAIIEADARGAAITVSWHCGNPAGGNFKETSATSLTDVLPGGPQHENLLVLLDRMAAWLGSMVDAEGEPIPILFRPWHEHTGGWFWWGCDSGSDEDYNELWRLTVRRLRDHHQLHHLIWVISPSRPEAREPGYLENRFPGLEWVDVFGFDAYPQNGQELAGLGEDVRIVCALAREHGKLAAATELGYRQGINNYHRDDWYAGRLLPLLKTAEELPLAWALTWRNAGEEHYWIPVGDRPGVADFKTFVSSERVLMLKEWRQVGSEGGE